MYIKQEKKKDLVSIIVPVYNGAEYIEKCLNSLMHQTYKLLEVIIIDDGSTDNTAIICKKICVKDARFRYYYQSNAGVSSARNNGIKISQGEYIVFVDADDMVSIHLLEYLDMGIKQYNASISICSCEKTYLLDKPFGNKPPYYHLMKRNSLLEELYDEDDMKLWSVCGKMFDVQLFDNIEFMEGKMYEDVDIVYRLLDKAKKVVNCQEVYYYYYSNPDSATKRSYNLKRLDQLWALEGLIDFLERKDMRSLYRKVIKQYLYLLSYHHNEIKKNQLGNKYLFLLKKKMKSCMKRNKRLANLSIKNVPFCYETLYPLTMRAYWTIKSITRKIGIKEILK